MSNSYDIIDHAFDVIVLGGGGGSTLAVLSSAVRAHDTNV